MSESGLTQLSDGVWAFLRPSGGWGEANTGLVVAQGTASLVVDTVWDVAWAKRVAEVQQPLVADAPITEAVNTHSDGDHWWGNDTLPAGTRITTSAAALGGMHEDLPPAALTAMATTGELIGWMPGPVGAAGSYMARVRAGARFPRRTPRFPDHTFDETHRLTIGDRTVELERLGPCHTAGDLVAHVPTRAWSSPATCCSSGRHPSCGTARSRTGSRRSIVCSHGTPTSTFRVTDHCAAPTRSVNYARTGCGCAMPPAHDTIAESEPHRQHENWLAAPNSSNGTTGAHRSGWC